MDSNQKLESVKKHVRTISCLDSTRALLEWDERTGLPSAAGDYRAEQIALLSGMTHEKRIDPQYGDWLQELADSDLVSDPVSRNGATILKLLKEFKRNTKLPTSLVERLARATVLGQQNWEKARHADDWKLFEPHLASIFALRKEEAELIRSEGQTHYDAHLDLYEEGAKSENLKQIFAELRDELVRLVQATQGASNPPDGQSWRYEVPVATQRDVSRWIAAQIGYDFQRGRLDETSHPFCTTLGPDDCRILTRYQSTYFPSGFYGTLHEAGHGLYEQGLPTDWYGLPPGQFASLGVHESQSRMWENMVGRSAAFWQWAFPQIAARVGESWDSLNWESFYRDANLVRPSLIRVEADEVTYNLHVLIRFEIEQALMSGELSVVDAPAAWNERYEHYLGIRPPSDKDGILQDVHWSAGLVGYFPTYTLGNIYAAQLMEAIQRDVVDLPEQMKRGEFVPLLGWLREKVHSRGACLHPGELIAQVSGGPISAKPLVAYLETKLTQVYQL